MQNRVSIKSFLSAYVTNFAIEQLGTDDLSEAVNQIILDHKRGKCGCSKEASAATTSTESNLLAELEALPGIAD